MAGKTGHITLGPHVIRTESGKRLLPSEIAERIENFYVTSEGTLKTIHGYTPYVPGYNVADNAPASAAGATSGHSGNFTYGRMHGIFHTVLANGRDLLLVHTGDQLWVHAGWFRGWDILLGPSGVSPAYTMELENVTRPRWPTQFVATPNGVVILPYEGRPMFYDGEIIAPLGYQTAPSAPQLRGPQTPRAEDDSSQNDVNVKGYAHDGNPKYPWFYTSTGQAYQTQMYPDFGSGRIGTVKGDDVAPTEGHAGRIEKSEYVGVTQWVDHWGNLSPVSSRSAPVVIQGQSARYNTEPFEASSNVNTRDHLPDLLLKQLLWVGITTGPELTLGRILGRSKDLLHSGTIDVFEMPGYAGSGGAGAFATVPDNACDLYADNTPDSWLVKVMEDIALMPRARFAALAMGHMWFANDPEDPGVLRWSKPGQWGTCPSLNVMYPDPQGRELRGLHPVPGGLLAFTETSTFLVVPDDTGRQFRAMGLSTTVGCAAPDSIATMGDGRTIWLTYEGWYAYNGEGIEYISGDEEYELELVSNARLVQATAVYDPNTKEYRCWVVTAGNTEPDTCFVFDGLGWRRRTDLRNCAAVCVTKDHRRYVLAAGVGYTTAGSSTDKNGVWILDRENYDFECEPDFTFRSGWMDAASSKERKSFTRLWLWQREMADDVLAITVHRDWRQDNASPLTARGTAQRYPLDNAPYFWDGDAVWEDSDTYWTRPRPFWTSTDFHHPSAEVIQIRIAGTTGRRLELIALAVDAQVKGSTGARSGQNLPAGATTYSVPTGPKA